MRPSLRFVLPLIGMLLACGAEELVTPPVEEEPPSLRGTVLEAGGEPAVDVKINLLYELVGYPAPPPPIYEAPPPVDTLMQNFPNPFNPLTRINFGLAEHQPVHLMVLDTEGDTLRTLVQEFLPAGLHTVDWDGRDAQGTLLPNDVYRIQLVFHADVGGPVREIEGVFSLSRDAMILAESALALTDAEGRFSISLSGLPVDLMIPVTSTDGVLWGYFPVSSILQVHAGRTGENWDRITLDIGDGNTDIAVELQLP